MWVRLFLIVSVSLVAGCSRPVAESDAELLAIAKRALKRADPEKALPALEELLRRHPDHPEALLFRAQLARDSGDDAAALEFIRQIRLEKGAVAGTARFLEGSLLVARGTPKAAEKSLREAIQLHPTFKAARIALIELLLLQLRSDDARDELLSLRKIQPWGLQQYVQFQLAPTELARPEGSRALLRKFVTEDPTDATSLIALVRDELAADSFVEAQRLLQNSPLMVSDRETILGLLTEVLVRRGETENALQVARTLTSHDSPWVWRGKALLADARSDWNSAAVAWWHVIRGTPDDRHAHYRLAVALDRSGRKDEAQLQFQRTRQVELYLDHVTHILAGDTNQKHLVARMAAKIAELLIDLNRPNEAQLWLEFLAASAPDYPSARELWTQLQAAEARPLPKYLLPEFGQQLLAAAERSEEMRPSPQLDAVPSSGTDSAGAPIQLVDQHESANLDFQHFNGPSRFKYLLESLGGGVAVLDYDADGWPDLYFPQGCSLPYVATDGTHTDHLFRNLGNGTFQDVTASTTIFENRYSQGVATADFDNDGFPDIFVANYGRNSFFRNLGDGTFQDVSAQFASESIHWSSSVAWCDLNRDSLLDLYVVNYVLDAEKTCRTPTGELAACSPGNFEGEPDLVYLNAGDGSFRRLDLTAAGLQATDGKGLGILTLDIDDDGWQDIYVSNDGTPNFLFRHAGKVTDGIPQFVENGYISGTALSGDGRSQAGMGISAADFSHHGRFDLYVTNFYNDYNTFYRNLGDGLFEDATAAVGLVAPTLQLLGFGTQAIDFNRDGWPDLIIANGHIDDFSTTGVPWKMPLQLFQNRGGAGWQEPGAAAGTVFQEKGLGRAVAAVDWNRDAHPDAVAVFQDRPAMLLTNQSANAGRFFTVRLIGRSTNRDAIGARIRVEAAGRVQIRELTGGDGYFATNDRRLIFGLGTASQVDRLHIRWGDGTSQEWTAIGHDSSWIIHQADYNLYKDSTEAGFPLK